MASIQSAITKHLSRAFTIFIPSVLQAHLERLPTATREGLMGELYRLAAQAGQERDLLPRQGPVIIQFLMDGCDVDLELDAPQGRLTLVGLERPLL